MYLDSTGIYQIRNILDNKIYIGSTINLRTRRNRHFSELKFNRHYNIHLQRAYNRDEKENFVFEILITCHSDLLCWYEQQFVDQWKPEYNQRKEVNSNLGVKKTPEMKKKIGDFFRGKNISEEHKRKIAYANMFKKTHKNKTGYTGVAPNGNSFVAKFRNTYLGSFKSAEDAHEAYKKARDTWAEKGGYNTVH